MTGLIAFDFVRASRDPQICRYNIRELKQDDDGAEDDAQ